MLSINMDKYILYKKKSTNMDKYMHNERICQE